MKKVTFFLAVASVLLFWGCDKQVETFLSGQTLPPPPYQTKKLTANAGLDTTICMPYIGTGYIFRGILNGMYSHDDSGKIVSWSWSEIGEGRSSILTPGQSLTEVRLVGGFSHQFLLKVTDDQDRFDLDTVTINIIKKFDYEYDGLSWDPTESELASIRVKAQPGQIESWSDFNLTGTDQWQMWLSDFNGECHDTSDWKKLPYVPYDSIRLTRNPVFYSLISVPSGIVHHGILCPIIYAKRNSGIAIDQKVSIGFTLRIHRND